MGVLGAAWVTAGRVASQAPPPPGHAEALAARARARLEALHAEAERLALEERTLLRQLRQLELARQMAAEERNAADADVAATGAAVEATDIEIRRLEQDRDREGPVLASRLVDLYKLGKGRYARLLLSTANVARIGQASRTVAALAARDQAVLGAFHARLAALARARAALLAQRREWESKHRKAVAAEAAATQAIAAKNALVAEIDRERDLTARLAGEMDSAKLKLEAAVETASGSAGGRFARLPIGPFKGVLPWPITHAERPSSDWRPAPGRSGIAIGAPEGTPVQAVHDGTVTFAGSFEGFGNLVIVDHGDRTFTLYGDLTEMAVGRGMHVDRGAPIGRSGAPPVGEAGLYFELRVDGRPVDPVEWLERLPAP